MKISIIAIILSMLSSLSLATGGAAVPMKEKKQTAKAAAQEKVAAAKDNKPKLVIYPRGKPPIVDPLLRPSRRGPPS